MNARCASVALPLPLFSEFSYFIPSFLENKIEVGSLVEVEFKNRYLLGWVVALEDEPPPSLEVKEILRLAPVVPLGKVKLLWAKTLSQLYLIPWGMVLSLFTPVLLPSFWEAAGSRVFSGSHDMDQKEGFSVPSQGMNFFVFQEKFGRKKKKWEKLVKNGVLRFQEEIFKVEDTVYPQGDLGWWSIATQKEREAFFLSFIDKAQKENKKTLLVFPDFRTLDHFSSFLENRFPLLRLIKYDSRLASRRRFLAYKLAEDGDFDVILGTRGSIFLPAQGLYYHVVLDPEDKGHYSDRPPFYDTFRLLREKIKITGGNLEVVSLTPTLSLYHFMTTGECKKRDFPSFSRISKPSVNLVSYEKKGGSSLTFSARKAILQTLSKEGKVLIWVQKKGYTPALGCRDCGFYYVCPHCGVALRYYKKTKMLVCPLCGGKREPDLFCPRCGGVWLEGWGEGVEKVGEEIKQIFPSQEVVVMNAEKEEEAKNLPLFSILVGTSLVLREEILQEASLLIIWSLEDWLYLSDINAREKFYLSLQRIQSLLGLNSSLTPQVFIQGRKGVEKEVSRFLQSPRDFYPPILEKRKKLGYPPYGVLVHLVKRCRNREKDELVLKKLKNDLEKAGIEVGGPFPAQGRKWGEESEEMTLRYSRDKIEEVFIVISKFFSQERKSRGEWRVEVEF